MKDNKYRVTSFRDEIFVDEKNIEEVIYRLNNKYEMMKGLYEDCEEEIERLNNIIEQTQKILYIKLMNENKEKIYIQEVIDIIENLKGSDKE